MFGDRPGPTRDLRELAEAVRIQHDEVLKRLTAIDRRLRKMATVKDLQDALEEQNADIVELLDSIAAEVTQINDALAGAGNVPQNVLDTVKASNARIKSATDEVKGIIEEPLPEPNP